MTRTRIALLGVAALALAAGCDVASAQTVDGGGPPPRRSLDGGVRVVRRADAGAPEDAGRRWRPRSDGGTPRRWRPRDAGAPAPIEIADAGVATLEPVAEIAPDGGTELAAADAGMAPLDAATVPEDGGIVADVLDGSVPASEGDAGVVADDAGDRDLDAGTLAPAQGDAGAAPPATAPAPPATAPSTSAPPAAPMFPPWLDPRELFARERERDDDRDRGESVAPIVTVLPGSDGAPWERLRELIPALPSERSGVLVLFGLIALAALGARWVARTRQRLPERGAIPRALALAHALLRVAVALLVIAVLAELLPDWARPALPWVVVATAVALGWSARDLLPDLVAGAVLLAERRLSRGEHVAIGEHAGVVLDVGMRVTTLRDREGRTVQVPNRIVLGSPTASRRAGWHEVRVRVRGPEGAPGEAFARALRDAVLLSAYVPVPTRVEVARDPDEPRLYVVRAGLLDARYEERFRGELLTRAEKIAAVPVVAGNGASG